MRWVQRSSVGLALALFSATICAAQALETETARPHATGSCTLSGNFEWQTSAEGRERAVPFSFEYGVTDRLELLVELVFGTAILPKVGRHAHGPGDLEATATYLVCSEAGGAPAKTPEGRASWRRSLRLGRRRERRWGRVPRRRGSRTQGLTMPTQGSLNRLEGRSAF